MRTIGFAIGTKENEKRRAILPEDLRYIKNIDHVYIEKNYGEYLGIKDSEYEKYGVKIVNHKEILEKDIICDPKIGDSKDLDEIKDGKTIFGYIHGVQNQKITNKLIEKKATVIAWEDMYEENDHVFWRNNELAGEAAILHAFNYYGLLPKDCKVALLGKGNVSRGAYKILTSLGSDVKVFDRKTEKFFKENFYKYDVIVNALLWDTDRTDHILFRENLKEMKKNSFIIDISCDEAGAIESSKSTTIKNPVYEVNGILHYVVDHTPSIYYKTASKYFSEQVNKYIDVLIEGNESSNKVLKNATILESGKILDDKIINYRIKRGITN